MTLTSTQLRSIAGPSAKSENIAGIIENLSWLSNYGIDKPHRLAQFLCQIIHESARLATTTEYASGAAYEGRRDLGNTQPGDGRRFRGRGLIQLTGRANARSFSLWIKKIIIGAPDFEKSPLLLAQFPWALYSAVWYWETRNLSAYADLNNIEMITRRINGGLNGYADRLDLYTRSGLVLLGYKMEAWVIKKFQAASGLVTDDIAGPKTRAAIHKALAAKTPVLVAMVGETRETSMGLYDHLQDLTIKESDMPKFKKPKDSAVIDAIVEEAVIKAEVAPGKVSAVSANVTKAISEDLAAGNKALVKTKPTWQGKTFWTTIVAIGAAAATLFGWDISPETQASILAAIVPILGGVNLIWKQWFTPTVSQASISVRDSTNSDPTGL